MAIHGCAWIEGDPADYHTQRDAIFCGRPTTAPDQAWCAEHRQRVYEPETAMPELPKQSPEETRQAA
jgi:hypothetical protein